MKKTLLAITLAAATVPFTFAAPQTGSTSGESQTKPAKKHKKSKKSKKSPKQEGTAATTPQK